MIPQKRGYNALEAPTAQAIWETKDAKLVVVGASIRADICIMPQVKNMLGIIRVAVMIAHQANTLLASTPPGPLVNGIHRAMSKFTSANKNAKKLISSIVSPFSYGWLTIGLAAGAV